MNDPIFSPSAAPVANLLQAHFNIGQATLLLFILGIFVIAFITTQMFMARAQAFFIARKKIRNKKTIKDIAKTKDIQTELDREMEEELLK